LRTDVAFAPQWEKACGSTLRISLTGLAGGHSGENIADGRANANKLIGRALASLQEHVSFDIAALSGGSKDNAIPREAEAVVVTAEADALCGALSQIAQEIAAELSADDAAFSLRAEPCTAVDRVWTKAFADRILTFICTAQNGIIEMSKQIAGLVEYSRNLGVIECDEDRLCLKFSSRSAIDSQLEDSARSLARMASLCGGEVSHHNRYPGWRFTGSSPLLDAYHRAYRQVYGEEPRDILLHAGLECGIIHRALTGLDAISCGPNERNIHSPDEALELDSLARFASVILHLLAE
jgi:dipeptidase D